MSEVLKEMTPEGFRAATNDARLVVLYPRNRYRDAYLAKYLKEPKSGFYYYSLQTSDRNLRRFLINLVNDLKAITGTFGENVSAALTSKAKVSDLAIAFTDDLNNLSSDPFVILLDQYDRLPEKDETKRFMNALVDLIPPQCQVVINARERAYMPWFDLVSTERAAVLGASYVPERATFIDDIPQGEEPQIDVFALGSGHVLVNGTPVMQWDGELPRNLFFFFVDRQNVTRDEIFDAFWPTLSVKEATNVFHVTKRKVNERLGYDLTQYNSGLYNYNEQVQVYYDVTAFSDVVESAVDANEKKQAKLWNEAAELYKSPFLHRLNMEWATLRRRELKTQHAQVVIGLGRLSQAKGDIDTALNYYHDALTDTPEREDVHRQIMELYHQQGRQDDAAAQYQNLETILMRSLGITPSAETTNLFKLITGDDSD